MSKPTAASIEHLTGVIRSVTDLWDEPLDEVHDVPQIVNALLAAGYIRQHDCDDCPVRAAVEVAASNIKREADREWTTHSKASDMRDMKAANRHGDVAEILDETYSMLRALLEATR